MTYKNLPKYEHFVAHKRSNHNCSFFYRFTIAICYLSVSLSFSSSVSFSLSSFHIVRIEHHTRPKTHRLNRLKMLNFWCWPHLRFHVRTVLFHSLVQVFFKRKTEQTWSRHTYTNSRVSAHTTTVKKKSETERKRAAPREGKKSNNKNGWISSVISSTTFSVQWQHMHSNVDIHADFY